MPDRPQHPDEPAGRPAAGVVVGDDAVALFDPERAERGGEGRRGGEWVASRRRVAVASEHDVEVAEDGTGEMSGLEGVTAGSAVEIPAHVHDPKCTGIGCDCFGGDDGRGEGVIAACSGALERGDLVDDVFAEQFERPDGADVFDAAVGDGKAHRREPPELVDDLVDVLPVCAGVEA